MKKRFLILIIAILTILTTISSYAIIEFPSKKDVPLNKNWTIKFNMNIDESTINGENIYILDSKDNKLDCELPLPDLSEYNFIQVIPKENYIPGEEYTLYIKDVISTEGRSLKDEITMSFRTVINPDEVINFPDKNLEVVIREKISKPTGDIYKSDVEGITILEARNKGITNINGIENLTKLSKLDLSWDKITDLNPLRNLANLSYLNLTDNKVSDISLLRDLRNLTYLNLNDNEVRDISILENLTNLTDLDLSENQISDISSLKGLTGLSSLRLFYNKISDINALENLTNLKTLYLSGNPIKDYSPVSSNYDNLTDKDFDLNQGIDKIINTLIILPSSDYDKDEAQNMIKRISNIPLVILEGLVKQNVRMKLVNNPITDEPEYEHLKGVTPRGWEGTGKTWDDIPGAGGSSTPIARIGYSNYGSGHGSINLELHELSHTIDNYITRGQRLSNSEEFKSIWRKEVKNMFPNKAYFINYSEEYLAETMAMFYLNGESKASLKSKCPLTYNFIDQLPKNSEILKARYADGLNDESKDIPIDVDKIMEP